MLNSTPLTKKHIDTLIASAEREGQQLDYKSQVPGKGDDKEDVLRHVAGMANTSGGCIVLGVDEERENGKPSGVPMGICGLAETNLDDVVLRLSSMIDSNISPRIVPRPEVLIVEGTGAAPVVVIRVKRSVTKPHMFRHRFYARQGPQTNPLQVEQVRVEFLEGEELPRRLRDFRAERIADIIGGGRAGVLGRPANMVVHICPLEAFSQPARKDVSAVVKRAIVPPSIGTRSGVDFRMNFDGACACVGGWGTAVSYMQVFKDGCIEFATSEVCGAVESQDFPILRLKQAATLLVVAVPRVLSRIGSDITDYPLAISVTLLSVRGARATFSGYGESWTDEVQEDRAFLPELIVEEPPQDWGRAFKSTLDAMWHGVGHWSCNLYVGDEFQGAR